MAKGKYDRVKPSGGRQAAAKNRAFSGFLNRIVAKSKSFLHSLNKKPSKKTPGSPAKQAAAAPVKKKTSPKGLTLKKLWNIAKNVLVWVIILAAVVVVVLTMLSVTVVGKNNRTLFGYRGFVVMSGSMSATDFNAGDLVLVKNVDPAVLQPGDVISFTSRNQNNYGEAVTHKIRALTTNEYGRPAFITYGTSTNTDDEVAVTYDDVLGKYVGKIPKIGFFFQFVKTGPGYILCIFGPFALLILWQGLKAIVLFQQDKKEQMAKIQAERDQIAAEYAETRQMLLEVKQMHEELMKNQQKEQ